MTYTEYRARTEGFTVVRDCDPSLPLMFVDPRKIEQVFLNLMINAFHAMTRGGVLKISARRITRDVGDVVRVEFADNGHGIAEENIREIFNPFFSTKERTAVPDWDCMCPKKIVEQHQGTIDVTSNLEQGTTFVLEFPAIKKLGSC